MNTLHFRKAELSEAAIIWDILQQAIHRRKKEGSEQWQDGYPNSKVVQNDLEKGFAYVLTEGKTIIGYCAAIINNEPEYAKIEGKWLTNNDFVVIHRIAIIEEYLGKGLTKKILEHIEDFALKKNIFSIKVDTNFDNYAMLTILEKSGYTFCGEVCFRGSPRKAFEKVLLKI